MVRSSRSMITLLCARCACSLPALDSSGVIRCGERESCPMHFDCTQGRCCPRAAAPSTCPLGLDASSVPPEVSVPDAPADLPRARCTPGAGASACATGQECRQGTCCDLNAGAECPPGGIGAPCSIASECTLVPGATVLCQRQFDTTSPEEELPRGYCTSYCDPRATTNPCGPQGVCVDFFLGFGACVARCTVGRACRRDGPGYICLNTDIGMNRSEPICAPDCAAGTHCATNYACYAAGHVCLHDCLSACPVLSACSPREGVCLRVCTLGCQINYRCEGDPRLCRTS